jgi:hypothetical protein
MKYKKLIPELNLLLGFTLPLLFTSGTYVLAILVDSKYLLVSKMAFKVIYVQRFS